MKKYAAVFAFIKADELIITVNNYGIDSKKVVAFLHGQRYMI